MGLKIKCGRCRKKIKRMGGLAFSPPKDIQERWQFGLKPDEQAQWTTKHHLCQKCWYDFASWMEVGKQ